MSQPGSVATSPPPTPASVAGTCSPGARAGLGLRPCLLASAKSGDHTCSNLCSQGGTGRLWWDGSGERLLETQCQDQQVDGHAGTKLKHR